MSTTSHRESATSGQLIVLVDEQPQSRDADADEIEGLRAFIHVLYIASRLVVLPVMARRQLKRDLDTLHAELAGTTPRRSIISVLFDEIELALNSGQLPESVRIVLESGPYPGRPSSRARAARRQVSECPDEDVGA
jgi:hypothetical protein